MKVITEYMSNNYIISGHGTVGLFCGAHNTVEQLTPFTAWYVFHFLWKRH